MKNKYISIALIIVIVILLFLLSSFLGDIHNLYTNGVFVRPNSMHNFYHLPQKSATLSDVNLIERWMTFGYLNKSFNLPSDYFQIALHISDSAYPNVTISRMAKKQNLSISTYLETVKNAVSAYLVQNKLPK